MNHKQSEVFSAARIRELDLDYRIVLLLDFIAVFLVYMIPTISHLISLPLYKFEPMRWVLLLNFLFLGDKKNAYIMAVTLPLFSFVVGTHPVFIKALIIAIELLANVFVFVQLSKKINNGIAMLISIVISKLIYYIIKYFCISTGLLASNMISISLTIQLLVSVAISLVFLFFSNSLLQKSI